MVKYLFIFCLLLKTGLVFADLQSDKNLQASGWALANYQTCSHIAESMGDKAMFNYYSEMLTDSSEKIKLYSKKQSDIVSRAFEQGIAKLGNLNQKSMELFCLSRFDALSRKMQDKKLKEDNAVKTDHLTL